MILNKHVIQWNFLNYFSLNILDVRHKFLFKLLVQKYFKEKYYVLLRYFNTVRFVCK